MKREVGGHDSKSVVNTDKHLVYYLCYIDNAWMCMYMYM